MVQNAFLELFHLSLSLGFFDFLQSLFEGLRLLQLEFLDRDFNTFGNRLQVQNLLPNEAHLRLCIRDLISFSRGKDFGGVDRQTSHFLHDVLSAAVYAENCLCVADLNLFIEQIA